MPTAQAGIDFTNEMFPGFAGMLPSEATGPQECLLPMALDFRSLIFEGMAYVPSYTRWLMQCDMVPAYRYHERVLKLLQWRCPPYRWWLKTPAHMLSIDALNAVYPDARFVMTHRDVGKVLPSVCALYSSLSSILTDHLDPLALGAHSRRGLVDGARQIDRLSRPVAMKNASTTCPSTKCNAIRSGRWRSSTRSSATSSATRPADACSDWWAESSRDRGGPGTPPGRTDFGLDPRSVAQQFAFYNERFGVRVAHEGGTDG